MGRKPDCLFYGPLLSDEPLAATLIAVLGGWRRLQTCPNGAAEQRVHLGGLPPLPLSGSTGWLTSLTTYRVTVNLILSATASILSRFWEPKVQGFLKGIPGGSPSIITDPGLLLMRLYGTCTGYLIPKASPRREVSGN